MAVVQQPRSLRAHPPALRGVGIQTAVPRQLTRAQILENKVLAPDEAIFLKYFPTLVQARWELMKKEHEKIRITPGSAEEGENEEAPETPGEGAQ